jgi:hypothetical protein
MKEGYKLVYINKIGINSDNNFMFELLFSNDIESVWGVDWEITPARNCGINLPDESTYDLILKMDTSLKLDLAQENSCFSMQDSIDGIIPLAWENIDEYETYPDDGRLILRFGETYNDVEKKLKNKNIKLNNDEKYNIK